MSFRGFSLGYDSRKLCSFPRAKCQGGLVKESRCYGGERRLSSQIQSSRHSGNSVLCPRSVPSTKRLIRSSRKSRGNHIARIKSGRAFLHSQGQRQTEALCKDAQNPS